MRKAIQKLALIVMVLCLSVSFVSFAEVSSIIERAVDKQSGYAPYYDNTLGLYGYVEYYVAAEPPVRCGVSHLSGLTEPLI